MNKSSETNKSWGFQDLMQYRIHEILLVASPYDAFILEEDGKLTEQILTEYIGMNLSYAPRVWNASSAKKANEMINNRFFDLIIVMIRISDIDPFKFSKRLKAKYPKKPIVLLAFDQSEIKHISNKDKKIFDEIFIWSGNSNVFPATIKSIEDKRNLDKDIKTADVRTIIFIEDTPRFYSSILPVLYKEIIYHTKQLIDKSLNNSQKLLHMRARPKIIHLKNLEDAKKYIKKYRKNILGIISDLRFPHIQKNNSLGGILLLQYIRRIKSSIPFILQTTEKQYEEIADKYSVKILNKNSPVLFKDLRKFMIDNFGFGDFKFRLPNGKILNKATSVQELYKCIQNVPPESLEYHSSNNHLSNWLASRGEFILSSKFRKLKLNDFKSIEKRRKHHLKIIDRETIKHGKSKIVEFSEKITDFSHNFIQIGNGSLGGKARGLAFANTLLSEKIKNKFNSTIIKIPKTIVIATDEFDYFIDKNNLWDVALNNNSNEVITNKFLKAKIHKELKNKLLSILKNISGPIAVRSSSLLEDSQYQPLAGMYSTFMLPNSHTNIKEKLNQLCEAVKRVYASTFFKGPKSLMDTISHRHEEEKMAVIIMELIGKQHEQIFYPTFSGVAQSYNYYPVSYMKRNEGVVFTALGLGKTIVDGEKSLRFSPKYPDILSQYYSIKSTLNNSQNKFYALKMNNGKNPIKYGELKNLKLYDLSIAERDGNLKHVASVISSQDNIVRDSLKYSGARVITFANILKYNRFPLTEIINFLMKLGEKALGCPVEIEFAVNLENNQNDEFSLLQIKPMLIGKKGTNVSISKYKNDNLLFSYSSQVLGNGEIDGIKYIMYVDPLKFKREATQEISTEIKSLNKKLGVKKPYLLMGPGRWGTADPWLGIPINWDNITNAKVIIEVGLDELNPDPSFGSHFFQNLTSLRIGYFTISKKFHKKYIDWDWLKTLKTYKQTNYVKVVKLNNPLYIKLDGIKGEGVILKNNITKNIMDEQDSSGI